MINFEGQLESTVACVLDLNRVDFWFAFLVMSSLGTLLSDREQKVDPSKYSYKYPAFMTKFRNFSILVICDVFYPMITSVIKQGCGELTQFHNCNNYLLITESPAAGP